MLEPFDATIEVRADGSRDVTERIDVDLVEEHHGIVRAIPVSEAVAEGDERVQVAAGSLDPGDGVTVSVEMRSRSPRASTVGTAAAGGRRIGPRLDASA